MAFYFHYFISFSLLGYLINVVYCFILITHTLLLVKFKWKNVNEDHL